MSTIAAISTPNAAGGLAVIRISGENALEVAGKIFSGKKKISEMRGYTCAYGHAVDNGEPIDDCVLTVFLAPHSYTGEDTAEISCHGGILTAKKILRAALNNGAENAAPGEFTKRAFLNGKMDLTQAEAVMDIISAKGEKELKIAENLHEGAVFKKIRSISDMLMKILGDLAAWADYPEEDLPEVEPQTLIDELCEVRNKLEQLIKNYDSGRILKEGISAVIVGRPNVGKSTLFNCLSGCERSIVTDIAGTTRDVIEETVRLGDDVILRLSDTAGIHKTSDPIEKIGVDIAEKRINSADLIIAVFDGSQQLDYDDMNLISSLGSKHAIAVVNKSDIEQKITIEALNICFEQVVILSARQNDGTEALCKAIENEFNLQNINPDDVTAANERQKKCVDESLRCVNSAIQAINNGEFLDAVTVIIDEAEQFLLELTGEKTTDAVIDEVFSRFCVGK